MEVENYIPYVRKAMIPSLAVTCQMNLSVKNLNPMPIVDLEIPPIDRNHMAKGLGKKATF